MLVSILPNGELNEIRLIESSGHLVLDKAAISIVKMASPFAPFPEEMLQSVDLIESNSNLGLSKKMPPRVSNLMPEIDNLSGHFLISIENQRCNSFCSNSLIWIIKHSNSGSLGLVVNKILVKKWVII